MHWIGKLQLYMYIKTIYWEQRSQGTKLLHKPVSWIPTHQEMYCLLSAYSSALCIKDFYGKPIHRLRNTSIYLHTEFTTSLKYPCSVSCLMWRTSLVFNFHYFCISQWGFVHTALFVVSVFKTEKEAKKYAMYTMKREIETLVLSLELQRNVCGKRGLYSPFTPLNPSNFLESETRTEWGSDWL